MRRIDRSWIGPSNHTKLYQNRHGVQGWCLQMKIVVNCILWETCKPRDHGLGSTPFLWLMKKSACGKTGEDYLRLPIVETTKYFNRHHYRQSGRVAETNQCCQSVTWIDSSCKFRIITWFLKHAIFKSSRAQCWVRASGHWENCECYRLKTQAHHFQNAFG